MKKLLIVLLLIATPLQAAPLDDTEADQARELISRLTVLKNLADGVTDETIPRQIKVIQGEIETLIAARDAEIQAERVSSSNTIRTIEQTYETQIDAKEASISSLRSQLP